MRRFGATAAAGIVVLGLGLAGGAASAQAAAPGGLGRAGAGDTVSHSAVDGGTAAPAAGVKPGSVWTLELNVPNDDSCEVETFASGGTFTSDLYSDSGTYTKTPGHIAMTWTAGGKYWSFVQR